MNTGSIFLGRLVDRRERGHKTGGGRQVHYEWSDAMLCYVLPLTHPPTSYGFPCTSPTK